jgi:hypothetical protein
MGFTYSSIKHLNAIERLMPAASSLKHRVEPFDERGRDDVQQ